MQSSTEDRVEEIRNRLITARNLHDTDGIIRSLYDLEDIGWKNVSVVTRYVGRNGERLELKTYLRGRGMQVIAPGMSLVWRYIWKLRFRKMIHEMQWDYLKHENDMSPEEYAWWKGLNE